MKRSPIAVLLASRVHGAIAEAEALSVLPHMGLRGRFRELVISDLLGSLLPPSCVAIHGTAVDTEGSRFRGFGDATGPRTEDDVLVVDRDRVPALLFSESEGIVPIESVLAKIEVKSTLRREDLRSAVEGASLFAKIPLTLPDEDLVAGAAIRCLFAFRSDGGAKDDLERLLEIERESGWEEAEPPIQAMCVVGRGAWLFASLKAGAPSGWYRCPADSEHTEVLTFLATLMNTLPALRDKRKGARLGSHVIDVENELRPA